MCTEPHPPSFFPATAFLLLGIGSNLERIYIVHSYAHCVAYHPASGTEHPQIVCLKEILEPVATIPPDSCTVIVSMIFQETITQLLRAWLFWENSFQSSYLENGDQSTHLWHLSMCGVVTWSCAPSFYSFKIFCCLTVAYIYVITVISTAVPAPLLPEPSCQQVSLLLSCPTVCSLLIQLEFLALSWLGDNFLEKGLHHWREWHSLPQQLLRPHVCLLSRMC